jgi:hypothetical protein
MTHFNRLKYLRLVPAIYFATIGTFDIVSDAVTDKLMWQNLLVNIVLFLPLLVSSKAIQIIFGLVTLTFSVFAIGFLLICFDKFSQGTYSFYTIVVGPLIIAITFCCSVSLIYTGTITSHKTANT